MRTQPLLLFLLDNRVKVAGLLWHLLPEDDVFLEVAIVGVVVEF